VPFGILKSKAQVKSDVNKLLVKLQHRKSEGFFTSAVKDQPKESEEEGQVSYEEFKSYCVNVVMNSGPGWEGERG
jgi:hypothetical protein